MNNLYRSSDEKVIAGVCAGIAHRLDFNVTGLRWVLALTTLFLSGVLVLVYLVLWAILKERSTKDVYSVGRHNCRNFSQSEFEVAQEKE